MGIEESKIKEIVYEAVHEATQGREVGISKFFGAFEKKLDSFATILSEIEKRLSDHDVKIAKLEQTHDDEDRHKNRGFTILGMVVGVITLVVGMFITSLVTADSQQKQNIHETETRVSVAETSIDQIKLDVKAIADYIRAR